jgi:hypothetical protein
MITLIFKRTIVAGDHRIVFLIKGPLHFVAVSKTEEPESELFLQLEYLYQQIIMLLTEKIIDILKSRSSFDLRNLLGGTHNVLHSLIHVMSRGLSFSLKSIRCLNLPKPIRTQIGDLLLKYKTQHTM